MGRLKDLLARKKRFEPEGHRVSGGMAEVRLGRLVRSVIGDAKAWDGLRIPDPENGGRREIDMVIARGDEVLFVEQKHWSGHLSFEDGRFLQTRRSGEVLDHGNILEWTARKGRLLEELMKKENGHGFGSSNVVIVFSNHTLEMQTPPEGMWVMNEMGLVELIEKGNRDSPPADVDKLMEGFGTWDTVHLRGGMALNGDVRTFGLGLDDWHDNMSGDGLIKIKHTTSWFSLIRGVNSKLVASDDNRNSSLTFSGRPTLTMHVVGEKVPRDIEWSNIFKIELSRVPTEWGTVKND